MKARELREETTERLLELLKEKRRAVLDYRVKAATSHDLNPKDYRNDRKDIARILTILRERAVEVPEKEQTDDETKE